MLISFYCPNKDCEADLEAEITLHGGCRATREEPAEDPEIEIERDTLCPYCGTNLDPCDDGIRDKTFETLKDLREAQEVDRYEDRMESRRDRLAARYGYDG